MKGFSSGEKDLYREIHTVHKRFDAEKTAELEKTKAVSI